MESDSDFTDDTIERMHRKQREEEDAIGKTAPTFIYVQGNETSSDESDTERSLPPAPSEGRLRDAETKILKANRKLASSRALLRNHPENKSALNEANQHADNLELWSSRIRDWANHYGLSDVDPDVVAILENEQLLVRKPIKRSS